MSPKLNRCSGEMESDGKSKIKPHLLRDDDVGEASTNAGELIAACSALLVMSGKKVVKPSIPVRCLDNGDVVHGQKVPSNLNNVSPVAQPNLDNFHNVEGGRASVDQPRLNARRRQSDEEGMWMKNYRALQVSYRWRH